MTCSRFKDIVTSVHNVTIKMNIWGVICLTIYNATVIAKVSGMETKTEIQSIEAVTKKQAEMKAKETMSTYYQMSDIKIKKITLEEVKE